MAIHLPSLAATASLALLATAMPSTAAEAAYPLPAFPVGQMTASPAQVQPSGIHPSLSWKFHPAHGHTSDEYVILIRQIQHPGGLILDTIVDPEGTMPSGLPVDTAGSQFEFWAFETSTINHWRLDTTAVIPSGPTASLTITSADPYPYIPRTRADQPFTVHYDIQGLLNDPQAPDISTSVDYLRHLQSYPGDSDGSDIDRTQAQLYLNLNITSNGSQSTTFESSRVPYNEQQKVRGEERFTIMSKPDGALPALILKSSTLQVWPVHDGSLSGLDPLLQPDTTVTVTLNDLYPSSTTFALLYPGDPYPNDPTGNPNAIEVDGSRVVVNNPVPANAQYSLSNLHELLDSDGRWTLDILTETPFGVHRVTANAFDHYDVNHSSASIIGLGEGDTITPDSLSVTLDLDHLYPKSTSYAILYPGPPQPEATGTPVPDTTLTIDQATPADRIITIPGPMLATMLNANGTWTMEVLMDTAWGTTRLATVSFNVEGIVTLADWRLTHFGSSDNTGPGADDFDFDHDGITNLMEFAFGLNPHANSSGLLPSPTIDDASYTLSFTRPAGVRGITYGAEWSSTLTDDWLPIPDTGTFPQHEFRMPTSGVPARYIRTVVTPDP